MANKPKTKPTKNTENRKPVLVDAIVDAAAINEQVLALQAKLESLKSTIRKLAIPYIEKGKTSVYIDTPIGKCHVVLVKDHLTLAEGVDAEVLQITLPGDLFNTFFAMKPALRPIATEAWKRLDDDQRTLFGLPCPFVLAPRAAQVKLPR